MVLTDIIAKRNISTRAQGTWPQALLKYHAVFFLRGFYNYIHPRTLPYLQKYHTSFRNCKYTPVLEPEYFRIAVKDILKRTKTRSKWRQLRNHLIPSIAAIASVVPTIIYALWYHMLGALTDPKTTVLFLTIGSGLSVFALGEFVSTVFENIRWTLAGSEGISLGGFLGLSRATRFQGVLRLLFNGGHGSRHWCVQR